MGSTPWTTKVIRIYIPARSAGASFLAMTNSAFFRGQKEWSQWSEMSFGVIIA